MVMDDRAFSRSTATSLRSTAHLDVAVVLVERQDALHVLLQLLALHGAAQDEVLPLLVAMHVLDLLSFSPLLPLSTILSMVIRRPSLIGEDRPSRRRRRTSRLGADLASK
jgi:hypothetical protein